MLAAFSGNSETIASVVSISPAIEAAFCNAFRADLDDCHAADQLRQPLLQLLPVIVRSCLLHLRAQLSHAGFDIGLLARAFDDGRRVLVHHHPLGATQVFELDTFE